MRYVQIDKKKYRSDGEVHDTLLERREWGLRFHK